MPDFTVSNTKFVLPTAPNRPISLNGGMKMPGWSDIHGLDVSSAEDKAGFEESRARIEKLIATEIAAGILPLKIVVGGFSQGGALALHTVRHLLCMISSRVTDHSFGSKAMRSSVRLGGCVALSTWLPFRDEYPEAKSAAATDIKIFQVHGTADSVVRFPWGKSSHDLLAAMCAEPPRFMSIDGMGHSSHPREMAAVDQFLNAILS